MNSQQICKISRQKGLTEVKIFQKVLGGLLFSWNTLYNVRMQLQWSDIIYEQIQQQYLFAIGGWKPEGHKPIRAGSKKK